MMASNTIPIKIMLSKLLEGLVHGHGIDTSMFANIIIEAITLDSRKVKEHSLFIAVPGLTVDGRHYIDSAIDSGARAIIWECDQGAVPIPVAWRKNNSGTRVPVIAIEHLAKQVGNIADRFYQAPSKDMQIIGITGTNGKASCSHFIAQALDSVKPAGVIGTLGWGRLDNLQTTTHTTPDVVTCHKYLSDMRSSGIQSVAMEVSSHALDQERVNNIDFDSVVFTNLTHDHLDYHGSLDEYAQAKEKLFSMDGIRSALINIDDAFGKKLLNQLRNDIRVLSYGIKKETPAADIHAEDIVQTELGLKFDLHTPVGNIGIESSVYGLFNVYNLLVTAGILLLNEFSLNEISTRLSKVQTVKGRFSIIHRSDQVTVIIDYAHTPDALKQSLLTVREHFSRPVWSVFGCGGDRDKEKRPQMGSLANELADHIVITSDNPRNEPAEEIVTDILAGISDLKKVATELDRREAIYHALREARDSEVVLISGKGHESYQQIGMLKHVFNDADVVADYFRSVTK